MSNEADLLIRAFCEKTGTRATEDTLFGSRSLRVDGISDGAEGVQWNAWIEWQGDRQMAYAGVNLEGKKYDGWPVARLIEREKRQLRLFDVRSQVAHPNPVEVIWYRDAWQAATRPAIREKLIGNSPQLLHTMTEADWMRMLQESYECLDPSRGHRGRAQQLLTLPSGERREYPVSPHFQFRQPFWPRDSSLSGWSGALDEVMINLRPLYEFVAAASVSDG